jgi:CRP/FNR family transcriptional regulator
MARTLSEMTAVLRNAPRDVREAFDEHATRRSFAAGEMLAFEGGDSGGFFVVIDGVVRAYKISESGRELTLYRVRPDECCVLTVFAVLSGTPVPAFAVAETDVTLALVSPPVFREWIDRFPFWREHVFTGLSRRLGDIMHALEQAVFHRVDARIASYFLRHADADTGRVAVTHERLATEIGTGRVVVSRVLKNLERSGIVKLSRGSVEIVDGQRLRAMHTGARSNPEG